MVWWAWLWAWPVTHVDDDLELLDVGVFGGNQFPDGQLLAGLLLGERLERGREGGREGEREREREREGD